MRPRRCRATSASSGRAPAAASSPPSARRRARTSSSSRWAATATRPTSRNLEIPGYFELYYGGGLATSESGSIGILAGQTLGGGTVVNYMNCVRTPDAILAEWESHGLEGLGDGAFVSDHMDAVMERIGANTEQTRQNNTHQKLLAGCDELGYDHRPIWRNASPDDDAEFCGHCLLGCQRGCKRSAMKTWLQDASDGGGRVVVGCHADKIRTQDGRATGVEASVTHADGSITNADRRRADRRRRLRRDRVARAAAAQRHRRARRRQAPAAASRRSSCSASTTSRSRAGTARSSLRCQITSSRSRTAAAS